MTYRVITGSRNIISWTLFFGILLVELGIAWIVQGQRIAVGLPPLSFYTAFDLMFGGLLLAHGLLKRGYPYRIGKLGTFFGVLFLAVGVAGLYGLGVYGWAIFFIMLGLVVIIVAAGRKWF